MFRALIFSIIAFFITISAATAQGRDAWIQVEAYPSEEAAMARLATYQAIFPMLGGFELNSGWHAIAVGPFTEAESTTFIEQFVRAGLIPRDSYITTPDRFAAQFYPSRAASTDPVIEATPLETKSETAPEPHPAVIPEIPDETLAQARAAEQALSRFEKMELQKALAWSGHYTGSIDGLFGRGTRASMERYQAEKGYEVTGILTTGQREALFAAYNAIFEGLDLARVANEDAGIAVEMPRAVVALDSVEAPFVHYPARDGSAASVHLISLPGDRDTLYALYEVMQSLEVVPLEGARKRNRNNFVLTGRNDQIASHTEAYLDGGQIKGFTLVWPANDRLRFDRLVERMQLSFTTTYAVLPRQQSAALHNDQDSLAGLDLRQPSVTQSGVFVNDLGQVLTSAAIGTTCSRITVMDDLIYEVAATSPEQGLSLLTPTRSVTPLGYASLRNYANRSGQEVAVAGYAYGGLLGAPTLTFGRIEDVQGLNGETTLNRLSMQHFEADQGGVVLANTGEMVGILQGAPTIEGRQLPSDVTFMTDSITLKTFLTENQVAFSVHSGILPMDNLEMEALARSMAVWVSCWE